MVARRPPEDAPVFVPASSIDRVALRGLDEFLRKPYVRVNAPPVGVGAATTQDAGAKAESKTYAPPPPSAGTAPPSGGNPNPFPPMPTKKDARAAATALRDRTNGGAAAPKPRSKPQGARPVVELEIPDDDDLIAAIDVDAVVQLDEAELYVALAFFCCRLPEPPVAHFPDHQRQPTV